MESLNRPKRPFAKTNRIKRDAAAVAENPFKKEGSNLARSKLSFTQRRKKPRIQGQESEKEELPPLTLEPMSQKVNRKKSEKKKDVAIDKMEDLFESKEEESVQEPPKPSESQPERDSSEPLRALLSRLGGINEALGGTSIGRNRLNTLLEGIQAMGNDGVQLQNLVELCDYLAVGTEDNMSNFNVDAFVPALRDLLNCFHNPEIMLLSCRALAYLMEALPSSCSNVVTCGVVPLLVERLLSIEYIDLAELALQCLEKISIEYSSVILKAGGLAASLTFLDFFQTGTQRTALSMAANVCRQVPVDSFNMVIDAIPILTTLVESPDPKVSEKAILCFSRLAESFLNDRKKLAELSRRGLPSNLMKIISEPNNPNLPPGTTSLVLRLLAFLCHGCPELSEKLLAGGITTILHSLLTGKTDVSSTSSPVISSEQFNEILSVLSEVMPPLPSDWDSFLPNSRFPFSSSSLGTRNPSLIRFGRRGLIREQQENKSSDDSISEESEQESKEVKPSKEEIQDPRQIILQEHPQYLFELGQSLLQLLIQVFSAIVNSSFRPKCLSVITKIIYFSSAQMLETLLRNLSFSSFMASLLASSDWAIVATALKICQNLMEKLPVIFEKYFKREGVVYEIQRLSNLPVKENSLTQESKDLPTANLQSWVKEQAISFRQRYFASAEGNGETTQLRRLNALCSSFQSSKSSETLAEMFQILTSDEGISTFEFVRSGIIEALLDYLAVPLSSSREEKAKILDRVQVFCQALAKEHWDSKSGKEEESASPLLLVLVQHLNHALSKVEEFPVTLSDVSGTASGLKYLTQPFKVKLQLGDNQASLKDYSDNIVLVEPLATVRAIEEFLLPKVFRASNKDKKEEEKSDGEGTHSLEPEKLGQSSTSSIQDAGLDLWLNGQRLSSSASIFQAIQTAHRKHDSESQNPSHQALWEGIHILKYTISKKEEASAQTHMQLTASVDVLEHPYLEFFSRPFQTSFESTANILSLLRILYGLNSLWIQFCGADPHPSLPKFLISPTEFINRKISSKLLRQLQDPLTLCSGALPLWCKQLASQCAFLFPFECRKLYYSCTSFGIARALQSIQQHIPGSNSKNDLRIGRIQRQKVRISREKIFESALKVMELCGKSKAVLEVEYFNEVGTGLGPTLEFFTLVSRELQRKDLKMWRDEKPDLDHPYVYTQHGLFPRPIRKEEVTSALLEKFAFLGTFVAKALLDSRLLDLSFSVPFLRRMLGKKLSFYDLKLIDPEYGSSLEQLIKLCKEKEKLQNDPFLNKKKRRDSIRSLKLRDSKVEDLDLDFTLPGYPNWELKPNGSNIAVTIDNLNEYVELVVQQHLASGVSAQFDAFEKGFNQVFPIENLSLFSVEELQTLLCGCQDADWSMQVLIENTRCDHGFSHNSPTVQYFLQVLSELSPEEQQKFLLFVTGSPRLPIGGFKALEPKLTIVRKEQDRDSPDSYLPSVNCCFYYLKLPEYSSKELLKEKLLFAIENGQAHFSFN